MAEMAAPIKGATMKSHNCVNAIPPPTKAGPILRAGFTEVPVIGIHTMWIKTKVSPIASPPNPSGDFLLVAPRTTKTNIKVNTVSAIKAGMRFPSAKPFAP